MTLRSSLLATLLLGDLYGLQLHSEIVSRTARRAPLNVGQVYATLERLTAARLVRDAGSTADGLRQYGLTPTGREAAEKWLVTPALPVEWDEMREQVLLVSTLPDVDATVLTARYAEAWRSADCGAAPGSTTRKSTAPTSTAPTRTATTDAAPDDLGADAALRAAALAWLESLPDLAARRTPLAAVRPRRGRRPGTGAATEQAASLLAAPVHGGRYFASE